MEIREQAKQNMEGSCYPIVEIQTKCSANKKCSFSIESILSKSDNPHASSVGKGNFIYKTEDSFINVKKICENFVDESETNNFTLNNKKCDKTSASATSLGKRSMNVEIYINEDSEDGNFSLYFFHLMK